jgi:hypothetical protein
VHNGFNSLTPKLGRELKGIDILAFMNAFSWGRETENNWKS